MWKCRPRARQRHPDGGEIFARPQCGLPVAGIELIQRQGAGALAPAQHQRGVERDQSRHGVADGRAVGDVAADGAGVADRHGTEPAEQLAEVRIKPCNRGERLGVGCGRAYFEMPGAFAHIAHAGNPAHIDQRVEVLVELGDPEANIGAAREDAGIGMGLDKIGQRVLRRRCKIAPACALKRERFGAGDRFKLLDRLPLPPGELVRPTAVIAGQRGIDNRPIAGAPAQVACDHIVDPRFVPALARFDTWRRST